MKLLLLLFATLATIPIVQEQASLSTTQFKVLRGLRGFVTSLSFSPDGHLLAGAGQDGTVRLWETSGWNARLLLSQPQTGIAGITFSPTGNCMVAGVVGTLFRWEAPDWRESQVGNGPVSDITAIAFSREGRNLALGRSDGRLTFYETDGWLTTQSFSAGDPSVAGLVFMPDGRRVLVAGENGTVRLTDWRVPREIRSWVHRGGIGCLAVSRTGATVVTGGLDGLGRVWDTETGRYRQSLPGHAESIPAAAFSPDNRILALGSGDGTLSLWSTADWKRLRTITGLDAVTALAWSPDSATLATAGWDKTVRIWRVEPKTP